jgi:hypothetical protein
MSLTYDSGISNSRLMQGDVLARTEQINEILRVVHPHFHQHPKNLYFMVLTQSCDLVPRIGGKCKAPYIAIAPARPLDLVIERHLAQAMQASVKADLPVIGSKGKSKASEFLQRLLNNNEPGYFYLDAEDTPLDCDCVAFLNLSIAVKSDLHFDACLGAKILQLDSTFQAKLGWLVGQTYSRVGTQDWDHRKLTKKVSDVLRDAAIWVEDSKVAVIEAAFKEIALGRPDGPMTQAEIKRAINMAPTKKQLVLKEAGRVIDDALGPGNAEMAERLRKRLESDVGLTSLLK